MRAFWAGTDVRRRVVRLARVMARSSGCASGRCPATVRRALGVASGRGARLGIFIRGYQALESSRRIDTVILDKTGTVTTGQLTVLDPQQLATVLDAVGTAIDSIGGGFTMQYVTLATAATRIGDA